MGEGNRGGEKMKKHHSCEICEGKSFVPYEDKKVEVEIDLDDHVLKFLEEEARKHNKTIDEIVEAALRQFLKEIEDVEIDREETN